MRIYKQHLAQDLGWSLSRLSHLLARMEEKRLIERRSTGKGRAMDVLLAGEGMAAATVQAAWLREHFFEPYLGADLARSVVLADFYRGFAGVG